LPASRRSAHPRQLPPTRLRDCAIKDTVVTEGGSLDRCTISETVVGVRMVVRAGCAISRSVLVGADYFEGEDEATGLGHVPRLGIGRDVTIDRAIIDKNARIGDGVVITPEGKELNIDADNYFIRDGIVVVPKDAVIPVGFWI